MSRRPRLVPFHICLSLTVCCKAVLTIATKYRPIQTGTRQDFRHAELLKTEGSPACPSNPTSQQAVSRP